MEFLSELGILTKDFVLTSANLITLSEFAPGLISAGLVTLLSFASVILILQMHFKWLAVSWLFNRLKGYSAPKEFTNDVTDIDVFVREKESKKYFYEVGRAWFEYKETLVLYGSEDSKFFKNSVRPSTFFNVEDLNFTPRFWRIVPGLFVTVGLFLTFLGLVSALSGIQVEDTTSVEMKSQLQNLLTTASAKFIMSLTGLLCSILFTIVLRLMTNRLENKLHELCNHTEFLLKFISLEDIASDQLQAIREQKDHFRTIGLELVAELGRPLREDLPATISKSIADAMSPLVTKVTQVGTEGVGGMVEDLSAKFSEDVGKALKTASESIEIAGQKIERLAAKMDDSSGNLNHELSSSISALSEMLTNIKDATEQNARTTNEQMSAGAENFLRVMSENLEAIRINTAEGASAISNAAEKMNEAAESFKEQLVKAAEDSSGTVREKMNEAGDSAGAAISDAGKTLLESFGKAAEQINDQAASLGETLLSPLSEFQEKVSELTADIKSTGVEFKRITENVQSGADASQKAAELFKESASEFSGVVSPINRSIERISQAINSLENTTTNVNEILTQSLTSLMSSSEQALDSAVEIIRGEQAALENSLQGMQEVIEEFRGQGDRLDDLDHKLGKAFEEYANHVEGQLEEMKRHAGELTEKLTPALNTMREVVAHAETFIPESGVNRR